MAGSAEDEESPYTPAGVAAALLMGLALLALFGELGLRILGYSGMNPKPWHFFVDDPLLGWDNTKGVRAGFSGPRPWPLEYEATVEIDSRGLRGPERPPPPPGALRVLAIGDSLTAAFEVPYEDSFAARLEEKLSRRLGAETRVMNGGVRGYGTDQAYLRYRERLRRLKPDLVLLTMTWNDVQDNVTIHRMGRPYGKAAFALDVDGELQPRGRPVPDYPACSAYRLNASYEIEETTRTPHRLFCAVETTLFDRSAVLTFVTMMVRELPGLVVRTLAGGNAHASEAGAGDYAERLTRRLVRAIAETARADGADFALAGLSRDLAPIDLDALRGAGVEVVSLDAVYADAPEAVRFRRDPHWNALGHERAAEILAPALARRLGARRAGLGQEATPTPAL